MTSYDYAESELQRAHMFDEEGDFYGGMTGTSVMELMNVFREQGHSGMSAGITLDIFYRLARYKPLTPLTGEDDEWKHVGDDLYQNKRYSSVFKTGKNGRAYNSNAKVFSDDGGKTWWTSKESRVYIDFPYTVPDKPEYVILADDKDEQ